MSKFPHSKAKKRRKKRGRKAPPTPQQVAQRKQIRDFRNCLKRLGFSRLKVDGTEITFEGRTGELDDCFLHENILILAEYTVVAATTDHITKKKILFDLIHTNQSKFIKFLIQKFPLVASALENQAFTPDQYRVRLIYVTASDISDEMEAHCPNYYFLNETAFRYFDALTKTIHRSARFELYKFLDLSFSEVEKQALSSASALRSFPGHLLPESYSSFPPGFKVVSFYADPATLLTMSYVLRRDSWRDPEGLYQRILIRSKIRNMRRYLATEQRVFVNNIIVTLPSDTNLNDPQARGRNLDAASLTSIRDVQVDVPFAADTIGLVDGQHRVFCYHEGSDKYENKISQVRERQNLLITGIVFPSDYPISQQRRFEAQLFLEINDTQARAKSGLKQSIELILNPFSTTAIARAVIQGLAERGPLKNLLQINYFDPAPRIKTTSIVSYGLKPLVKLDGNDSMFSMWTDVSKNLLKSPDARGAMEARERYIDFCISKTNDLLIATKLAYGPTIWAPDPSKKKNFLSPTTINGFLVCLRLLIQNKKVRTEPHYQTKLAGIDRFGFQSYRSSQWRKLGEAIFAKYFAS